MPNIGPFVERFLKDTNLVFQPASSRRADLCRAMDSGLPAQVLLAEYGYAGATGNC
jgi:hypothetical protein